MGAVFALFAGFYNWFPILMGYYPDEGWGKTHFFLMFIGVNVTFAPMHFLGLSGMPRRILDYPDPFFYYNTLASFGSLISYFSILPFFFSIYNSQPYIASNLSSTSLDYIVQYNRYHHLHSFNSIPVINNN